MCCRGEHGPAHVHYGLDVVAVDVCIRSCKHTSMSYKKGSSSKAAASNHVHVNQLWTRNFRIEEGDMHVRLSAIRRCDIWRAACGMSCEVTHERWELQRPWQHSCSGTTTAKPCAHTAGMSVSLFILASVVNQCACKRLQKQRGRGTRGCVSFTLGPW
jgi:hypothetical protein